MTSILVLLTLLPFTLAAQHSNHSFVNFPGIGSYRLSKAPLDWKTAFMECHLRGAHLAVLETRQEARVVKLMIDKAFGHSVGTIVIAGFHTMFSDSHWVTIFGHPLHSVYESWARNQPDNMGDVEMCGGINSDGLMEDIPCVKYEYPFVCEKYGKA